MSHELPVAFIATLARTPSTTTTSGAGMSEFRRRLRSHASRTASETSPITIAPGSRLNKEEKISEKVLRPSAWKKPRSPSGSAS